MPRVLLTLLAALLLAGCGKKSEPAVVPPTPGATGGTGPTASGGSPATGARPLRIGLSEANPHLLAPGAAPPGFGPFRDVVAALRPDYYRLVVDWSKLQPDPAVPADLALPGDGCARGVPPCAEYAGLKADLEAVRDARAAAGGGWEVVVAIYGVPDWAARKPGGCERDGAAPRARAITPVGLDGYRRLVSGLRALGKEVGVPLSYWIPWNEPNHPAFISPQRASCEGGASSLSPAVYGELVGAARDALKGANAKFVLGELAGFRRPTPNGTGVGEFIRALPDEVACEANVWSQHEYAAPEEEPAAPFARDAVAEAEAALAARPCTAELPIWVTETGVGGATSGRARSTSATSLATQCSAQAARLDRWADDPRVEAAFQYSFREDTAYPVGLADSRLRALYPTAQLWQAWADARGEPPARPAGCGIG